MGNGELSKMGCFESDLQEFRIRQETRGQLLSGSLDVPCALCPFGRGGDCDVWEKRSRNTVRRNRAERGGESCLDVSQLLRP